MNSNNSLDLNRNIVVVVISIILLLIVSFILNSCSVFKKGSNYLNECSYFGLVLDKNDNQCVIGASVLLTETKYGAMTDFDGMFCIKKVPDGKYEMRITHLDYDTFFDTIVIESGESTLIDTLYVTSNINADENVLILPAIKNY